MIAHALSAAVSATWSDEWGRCIQNTKLLVSQMEILIMRVCCVSRRRIHCQSCVVPLSVADAVAVGFKEEAIASNV